jgi:hypothetical protein
MINDIVVDSFDNLLDKIETMALVTIYQNPIDYPNKYVARLFDLERKTPYVILADELNELTGKLPDYMIGFERDINDDPCIVCTFM